ncbi:MULTISPECIES: OST-HTH/LOTUS domain-containing protein [unclassified Acinetobacter]|uniref:OST-HTH/LOTUS domain-containing protein n=1 Tax=unclassified Acinetobacter TaxID=196816 RepID=UPI0035BA9804
MRKKQGFVAFIKNCADCLDIISPDGHWISVDELSKNIIKLYPNIEVEQYGCETVQDAILKISANKIVEFDDDKKLIRKFRTANIN